MLSLSADTNRLDIINLRIRGKPSILSIRLEEEASPRIIIGIIARLFTVEGILAIGIPVTRRVLIGIIGLFIVT